MTRLIVSYLETSTVHSTLVVVVDLVHSHSTLGGCSIQNYSISLQCYSCWFHWFS